MSAGQENGLSYKDAGVDTKEGERAVSLMKEHVKKTFNANVLTGLGGFGSLFRLDTAGLQEPVLVAGTDGVGTKLKIAFLMDRHDTVGQDCVAMCVNDVLCQGAKPLFFLDYIATGRLEAEKAADIVKGLADGCLQAGCALVGGETAEMPGFYAEGEYDMAGFAVGVADRARLISGNGIREGDLLLGIPSSGLHSNGFSLVRKVIFEKMAMNVGDYVAEFGANLGDVLLTPTRIYASVCGALLPDVAVKGMVHVTGGGFMENIPRVFPDGLGVRVEKNAWDVPAIFRYIQKNGGIEEEEMFSTFNMGVGLILVLSRDEAGRALERLAGMGEKAFVLGSVVKGRGVTLC
ncbi:MAG: phosphoribosylformylglycinamidine cyclo-ligase [Clostridiales Family XIII bacterium]|jgi:phosphoribosylformylglycinamidine cyclo-ligase|nr:phosphoribosylformylglycinamidine cyclo-ligase [Clostridiales Family XIII bacterium]